VEGTKAVNRIASGGEPEQSGDIEIETSEDDTYTVDRYTGIERYGWMPVASLRSFRQRCWPDEQRMWNMRVNDREAGIVNIQPPTQHGGREYVNVGRPGWEAFPKRKVGRPKVRVVRQRFPIERRYVPKGLGFDELGG